MHRIWKVAKSYVWWTQERGSLHYDVMVSAILLFIFLSPRFLDYRDKPVERVLTPSGVAVSPDGHGGLFFEINADAVKASSDLEGELRRIIEPVSGEVKILSHKESRNRYGRRVYLVQVQR